MLNLRELDALYIIAEIGCNHNGDVELGKKMMKIAKECGANAVKFQYFNRKNLFTEAYLDELEDGVVKLENVKDWKSPELGLNNIREQIDAFSNDEEKLYELRAYAKEIEIDFGCTPVDENGVEYLKKIEVDFIKLSSMDLNNPTMIRRSIEVDLPLIISTGMATLSEIDKTYRIIKENDFDNFALLHCISIYPPKDEIINLNFIDSLNTIFDCEIGYSDHSLGFSMPLASIAKGAKIVEKHFTLNKDMPGWDHRVSADPSDLKIIATEGQRIFKALGSNYKKVSEAEEEKKKKFRRSIVLGRDMKKGEILQEKDLTFKRPGTGIAPDELKYVVGKSLNKDLSYDHVLTKDDLG